MIEVNLLPGGKKRSSRGGGFSFALKIPSFAGGGGTAPDPYLLGAIGAGVIAIGVMGWLFTGVRSDREELELAVEEAVQDSARFADLIARTNQLTARRDSIAQRVEIIQEIDSERYVWPHILDEIATALPPYTWLDAVSQLGGEPLELRMSGNAGSNFAITTFMRQLEASRFFRGVNLERSQQAQAQGGGGDIVFQFELTMTYETPPMEELETIPLFESELSSQMAAPDSAGGG